MPQYAAVVADAGEPKQYAPVVADAGEPKQFAPVVADAGVPPAPAMPPPGAAIYAAPQYVAVPQYGVPGVAAVAYPAPPPPPGGATAIGAEHYYAMQQQAMVAQYYGYAAAAAGAAAAAAAASGGAVAAPGQPTTAWIINRLIEREKARIEKNYTEADKVRSLLREQGVQVDDHLRNWTARDGRTGPRPNHNDPQEPE